MFCSSCWTLLPDEATYCWKCGKPQRPPIPSGEPQWETCEIVYAAANNARFASRFHFRARAMGPDGVYTAAVSKEFGSLATPARFVDPYYDSREEEYEAALSALNDLIKDLSEDGWKAMSTKGPAWYSYRFKRELIPG